MEAVKTASGEGVTVTVNDGEVVPVVCVNPGGTVWVMLGDIVVTAVELDDDVGTGRGDEVNVADNVGSGVAVIDGVEPEVGVKLGWLGVGVGVLVCNVCGHPPSGAGTRSSGSSMCGLAALEPEF